MTGTRLARARLRNRTLFVLAALAVVVGLLALSNLGEREPATATEGGNPAVGDGDVTVFLFEDYQCSHCRDYALGPAFEHLLATWVEPGNVTLVFKHVAFVGPYSQDAARASQCMHGAAPGGWLDWDHAVYAMQSRGEAPTPGALRSLAVQLGADGAAYDGCLADPAPLDERVATNFREFQEAGARGTPALLVGGTVLDPNDADAVDAAIREALDAAR